MKILNLIHMKRLLFLALSVMVLSSQFSYSQDIRFKKDSLGSAGSSTEPLITIFSMFYDLVPGNHNFKWVKIMKSYTTGWTTEVCDIANCYPESVDSAEFLMNGGDSGSFKVDFAPNQIVGNGKLKVLIFAVGGNRSNGDICTFTASTYLGIDGKPENLIISMYPVPSQNKLNINYHKTGNYKVEILDLAGKTILVQNDHHTTSTEIDITTVPSGYYLAKIISGSGKEVVLSFIRN